MSFGIRPMNILFVNERFGFYSAVEQMMFDAAGALRSRGHKCFLTVREGTGHDEKLYREAFDEIEVGWNGLYPNAVETSTRLRRFQCETLFVHKVSDTSFAANAAVQTIRMVHDHDVTCPRLQRFYTWSGKVCNQPVGWQCYGDLGFIERRGRTLTIKSVQGVKAELARQNTFDKVLTTSRWMSEILTLNGVDPTRIKVVHPTLPDLPNGIVPVPDNKKLLYVGRLAPGKGVDLLLLALGAFDEEWHLTIAGDGDSREELQTLAKKLGIGHKVEFLGWVPPKAARLLFDEARIVCLPSRWPEPFGLAGVEAMQRGRPVVAFDVGGISDWLSQQRTGLLVPEQDLIGYAGAIKFLLDDYEACSQMGERARWAALERFDFETYMDQLEGILAGTPVQAPRVPLRTV